MKRKRSSATLQKMWTLYEAIREYTDPKTSRQLSTIFHKLPSRTVRSFRLFYHLPPVEKSSWHTSSLGISWLLWGHQAPNRHGQDLTAHSQCILSDIGWTPLRSSSHVWQCLQIQWTRLSNLQGEPISVSVVQKCYSLIELNVSLAFFRLMYGCIHLVSFIYELSAYL